MLKHHYCVWKVFGRTCSLEKNTFAEVGDPAEEIARTGGSMVGVVGPTCGIGSSGFLEEGTHTFYDM